MKICCFCKFEKDEIEFNKNSSKIDGLQTKCKICSRAHSKKYYRENPTNKIEIIKRSKKYKKEVQAYIVSYLKEHPCVDCKEPDLVVLDFDHVQGKKIFSISYMIKTGRSIEKIKEEMDKCVVRCANCHRRKTAKDFNWYKVLANESVAKLV